MATTSKVTSNNTKNELFTRVQTDNFKYKPIPIIGILELNKQIQVLLISFVISLCVGMGSLFFNYMLVNKNKDDLQQINLLSDTLAKNIYFIDQSLSRNEIFESLDTNNKNLEALLTGYRSSDPIITQKIQQITASYGQNKEVFNAYFGAKETIKKFEFTANNLIKNESFLSSQIVFESNMDMHKAVVSVINAAKNGDVGSLDSLPFLYKILNTGINNERASTISSYKPFLDTVLLFIKATPVMKSIYDNQKKIEIANQEMLGMMGGINLKYNGNILLAIGITSLLLSAIMCFGLSRVLENNVNKVDELREKENRNLQQTISVFAKDFEVIGTGNLNKNFNENGSIIDKLVKVANQSIGYVRGMMKKIKANSKQTEKTLLQVYESSKNFISAAQNQTDILIKTGGAVQQLTSNVVEISKNSEEVYKLAAKTLDVTIKGSEAVRYTSQTILNLRDKVDEASKRMKKLNQSAQKVNDIVSMLQDLSEKTSVLAINASIQASKSGAGNTKAFDVIAKQMQELSKQSSEASLNVRNLVSETLFEISETLKAVDAAAAQTDEGAKYAISIRESLDNIERFSGTLSKLVGDINQKVSHQANSANMVSKSIQDVFKGLEGNKKQYNEINQLMSELMTNFRNLQNSIDQVVA